MKCVIHRILIQHGSWLKKDRTLEITGLLFTIATTEPTHRRDLNPSVYVDLSNAWRDLLQLLDSHALKIARDKARNHHYSLANKCCQHLARALHLHPPHHSIQLIHNTNKQRICNTQGISVAFQQYYSQSYNLPPRSGDSLTGFSPTNMANFISEMALPTVNPQDALDLDKPLSEPKFLGAIIGLKSSKCPDPNGFSPRFYKSFAPLISLLLTTTFNSVDNAHSPSKDLLSANVSILPKPGKDPSQCSSYYPLFLI